MGKWVKNVDQRTHAVPIGNGNVVALRPYVRPEDAVEIEAETPALVRLMRAGKVVRAGRPMQPEQVVKPAPVQVELERRRAQTEFAQRTMERGVARSAEDARRASALEGEARRAAAEAERLAAAALVAEKAKAEAEAAAPAAVPVVAASAPVAETDGTAEGHTKGSKGKRRWVRASEESKE